MALFRSCIRHTAPTAVLVLALLLILPPPAAAQGPASMRLVPTRSFKPSVLASRTNRPPLPRLRLVEVGISFQQWQVANQTIERHMDLRGITGLTSGQIVALGTLKDRVPGFDIRWDLEYSQPVLFSGTPLEPGVGVESGPLSEDARALATVRRFLDRARDVLRIEDPVHEFVPEFRSDPLGGTHIRLRQHFRDVPVYGREMVAHVDMHGDLLLLMGRCVPTPSSSTPDHAGGSLLHTAADAIARAEAVVGDRMRPLGPGALALLGERAHAMRVYDVPEAGGAAVPAWRVDIHTALHERWRVFLDARSGRVVRAYDAACSDGPQTSQARDLLGSLRTVHSYLHQGRYFMIDATRVMFRPAASTFPTSTAGTIVTLDARNTDLTNVSIVNAADLAWSDAAAVSAHANAGVTYEYFRTVHGRNSIDGAGSSILSVVNATERGQSMENAYWNGKFMIYGNGGQLFHPLAAALDVAAHEMTHGVTEHSANLEYLGQSGALNESFSDVLAAMVDRDDWRMGEDVTRPTVIFPTGAMRDLADPHNGGAQGDPAWQPKHMNEYQALPTDIDRGGVHINSGIPNHAAYLAATDARLGPDGRSVVERVFYRALTTRLTPMSRFVDFRLGIVRAAEELYPQNPAVAAVMRDACDRVGISDGTPSTGPVDLPPVDGPDRLLFVSVDPTDPFYLWRVQLPGAPTDFSALSRTPVLRRPSVSDNGAIAVFIDGDHNLRAISLNPAAPNEQVIDQSGIWNSVAISRNGKLLALTTTLNEAAIHVFDVSGPSPILRTYPVTTPNYSSGSAPNVARFADAMDFSHGSQTLLFDTYNEMVIDGTPVGFWDLNLMEVWDAASNAFATGRISRVFPQEPDVDVGNPVFSRNHQSVIAFDVQYPDAGVGAIMSYDLFTTGEPKEIVPMPYGELGVPSFRGDDRALSFMRSDAQDVMTIYTVPLDTDAMTAAGSPQPFVGFGSLPVWYRSGQRPVSVSGPAASVPDIRMTVAPNPFSSTAVVRTELPVPNRVRVSVFDVMGREIAVLYDGIRPAGAHVDAWDGVTRDGRRASAGMYLVRVATERGITAARLLRR